MSEMEIGLKIVLIIITILRRSSCTIDGLSYIDPLVPKYQKLPLPGEDPCNPLYWYPRQIPEHCYYKTTPKSVTQGISDTQPIPLPVSVPFPPQPISQPMLQFPPIPPQLLPPSPLPVPLPFGVPLTPNNPMYPVVGPSYQPYLTNIPQPYQLPYAPRIPIGMIPGLPGIVAPDGGVNILPFSDAYSDLLERHKQKMIRVRLQKLLDEYEEYPWKINKGRRYVKRKIVYD